MKTYNKLVRDRIPEVIQQDGRSCKARKLSAEKYFHCLQEKLKEEVDEYLTSNKLEELADILEVVYALAEYSQIDKAYLESIRLEKVEKRGAFAQRVFLESVSSEET